MEVYNLVRKGMIKISLKHFFRNFKKSYFVKSMKFSVREREQVLFGIYSRGNLCWCLLQVELHSLHHRDAILLKQSLSWTFSGELFFDTILRRDQFCFNLKLLSGNRTTPSSPSYFWFFFWKNSIPCYTPII